jgi:glycogen operon protein
MAFRKAHPSLHRERFFAVAPYSQGRPDMAWHGCRLQEPGWTDPASRVLAFTLWGRGLDDDLHVLLNAEPCDLAFEVPVAPDNVWRRAVSTAQA